MTTDFVPNIKVVASELSWSWGRGSQKCQLKCYKLESNLEIFLQLQFCQLRDYNKFTTYRRFIYDGGWVWHPLGRGSASCQKLWTFCRPNTDTLISKLVQSSCSDFLFLSLFLIIEGEWKRRCSISCQPKMASILEAGSHQQLWIRHRCVGFAHSHRATSTYFSLHIGISDTLIFLNRKISRYHLHTRLH